MELRVIAKVELGWEQVWSHTTCINSEYAAACTYFTTQNPGRNVSTVFGPGENEGIEALVSILNDDKRSNCLTVSVDMCKIWG